MKESFDSLIVKLSAIGLQASKFTKNELRTYFSTILAMRGLFFRWGASFLRGGGEGGRKGAGAHGGHQFWWEGRVRKKW